HQRRGGRATRHLGAFGAAHLDGRACLVATRDVRRPADVRLMNTDDWSRLEALIEAALAAPTRQRDRLLVERAAGDEALLAEARYPLSRIHSAPAVHAPPTATPSDTRAGEPQLPTIPGWRLQRRLGAGGMGEVFLATADHEPDGPRVAIKVLRHGLDSTGLL